MTDVLNINVDFEKLLKCYNNVKKNQKNYSQTENGKQKINEASRRYYNDRKDDPIFREKQRERGRRYRQMKRLQELSIDVKDEETVEKIV